MTFEERQAEDHRIGTYHSNMEAWNAAQQEQRGLLEEALEALERCYDVTEWPCDGTTLQDHVIIKLTAALEKPCTKS